MTGPEAVMSLRFGRPMARDRVLRQSDGAGDVYVMNADGTDDHKLTDEPGRRCVPRGHRTARLAFHSVPRRQLRDLRDERRRQRRDHGSPTTPARTSIPAGHARADPLPVRRRTGSRTIRDALRAGSARVAAGPDDDVGRTLPGRRANRRRGYTAVPALESRDIYAAGPTFARPTHRGPPPNARSHPRPVLPRYRDRPRDRQHAGPRPRTAAS